MYLQDLVVLVKAISSHGCIGELDLSYNVISDDGIKCLAEYLKVTVQKYYIVSKLLAMVDCMKMCSYPGM